MSGKQSPGLLSREPTALYDLLPAKWRNESSHLIR